MVCASVEALYYIFLSSPAGSIEGPELPAAIAIDKFLDQPLGETQISLGTGWAKPHSHRLKRCPHRLAQK
jgi:hypothetical protein